MGVFADIGVFFCKILFVIYDVITFPVYVFIDKPWNYWKLKKIVWAKLEDENDPYSSYLRVVHRNGDSDDKTATMNELFRQVVGKYGSKKCFGIREVISEDEETSKSGKVLKKLTLGEYRWMSYNQVDARVDVVSKGLLSLGIQPKKPVVLLAETRMEWIITAQACFRINVPIVTLYATLGEDGLVHGINETEVTHIITSVDLFPKLKNIFHQIPKVTHVVYMEGRHAPSLEGIPGHVKLLPFSELEEAGRASSVVDFEAAQPDDLAILMYTSGSTGVPKGVMITNRNVLTSIKGLNDVLGKETVTFSDIYIAYLPVAHVLELAAETFLSSLGVPIGFSSPHTLTDYSTAVKKGCSGDLKELRPTVMAAVPLMLDRMRKSLLQVAGKEGTFSRQIFDFAITYKTFWTRKGFKTSLVDRYILKSYGEFTGGRLRFIICGGAPLSADTQEFIQVCLGVRLIQGYGMTETAASSTVTDVDDYSVGRVGAPLSTCRLRLVDWEEGNYHATDKPHPRGEVVVGGQAVTKGYYKNEEKTNECFKNEKGMRWFYTGDISEVFPDGTFKIIDRKSDLVKLQFGEYIALGKVESNLKTSPLVENICTFGNGFNRYLVALVLPNSFHLKSLAKELGKSNLSFDEMCADEQIIKEVTKRLRDHGRKSGLFGSEIPEKIKLCTEEWTPESGLVTAALKLRRKIIEKHYKSDIDNMYEINVSNGVVKSQ